MGKKKRRLPIEQLKAAGKQAREMLRARGLEASESVIDELIKKDGSPILPGIPVYLPHKWTLVAAQRMMYDFLLLWREECKNNPCFRLEKRGRQICEDKENNVAEFWKFLVQQMRAMQKDYEREMKRMPQLAASLKETPTLRHVFAPMRKYEAVKAMHHFFADAFAVAIVVKRKETTGDFAEWFLDWTQSLITLWQKPPKEIQKI